MGLTVTGLAEHQAQMVRVRDRARNPRPFLEEEAPKLQAVIDGAWSDGVDPATGQAWPGYKTEGADGGSLRTAHEVGVDDVGMTVTVGHDAASYQFARRNPLPFTRTGAGYERAGEFWAGHDERLEHFLAGEEDEP